MQLNHIQIKLYAKADESLQIDDAIPIFHRWIQESRIPDALLIDVVDYAHVPAGPGILLMGHEEYYALEEGADKRLGLLFSSKIARAKESEGRVAEAVERALVAAQSLKQEPEFAGKLEFPNKEFLLRINDRRLAPNSPETFATLRPVLESGLKQGLGEKGQAIQLEYKAGDPRELFSVLVKR